MSYFVRDGSDSLSDIMRWDGLEIQVTHSNGLKSPILQIRPSEDYRQISIEHIKELLERMKLLKA